jgi:Double-GTPase 2
VDGEGCLGAVVGLVLLGCLVWIALPLAIAAGAGAGLVIYLVALRRSLLTQPAAERPSDAAGQPAYRQYLLGPAWADTCAVVSGTANRSADLGLHLRDQIRAGYFNRGALVMPVGVLLFLSLIVGAGAATATAGVALAAHAVVVGALQALALGAVGVLRVADAGLLLLRRITITCPACHRRAPRPVFLCPGCGARHTDLRPGRYGMLRRVCVCGRSLPTLLLLGSHRLRGLCPYCDHPLAERSGSSAEVVLPLLGPPAAGKTTLMSALVLALEQLSADGGGRVEVASADTAGRLDEVRRAAGGPHLEPTGTGLPRAYSLYATPARGARRLVHLFDTAGERLNRPDQAVEHRFLGLARTFVFVLDPMSVDAFWTELVEADRERLEEVRARQPPEGLFQEVTEQIQALGADTRRARAAVAVSKHDLVRDLPPLAGVGCESPAVEGWLAVELGLGNLVRAMRHEFREVRFFFTAVRTEETAADPSVVDLTRWLLGRDGPALRGRWP